tara:strand:+ start:1744 stop:1902 length:159 start_codon:yes stop_codon:yes gene_type:complete
MTPEQISNLEANVKQIIKANKDMTSRINEFIREAQKLGYSINPKTGKVKQLN